MRGDDETVGGEAIRSAYDAVVVGAGPAGCATAACLANRGATVLLVERNPKAARRFAGEWIHPEGARVLREQGLLDGLDRRISTHGFVVCANDGLGPIRLDYPFGDSGFACEHETLVTHLRHRVQDHFRVDYLEGVRACPVGARAVELSRRGRQPVRVAADRIVVAAGRSFRENQSAPAGGHGRVAISSMAGLLVRGAELPFEGFGHVIVGGPGPALAYRIDDDRIRLCVDVPHTVAAEQRGPRWVWESFSDVMPKGLRDGVRAELSESSLSWAANTFRPRSYETNTGVALVGDAAGVFHPLTAMGITISLLDAEAFADAVTLSDYAAKRAAQSFIPELLSNAIYQAFARNDAGASAIRDAMFRSWRSRADHRERTMKLLGATSTKRGDFLQAFTRVAVRAGADSLLTNPRTLAELRQWLRWPLASVHPRRDAMRARSVSWVAPESSIHDQVFRSRHIREKEQHAI